MSLDAIVGVRLGDFALDVTIKAAEGQTVAVLGRNGAGKTTLLRALAGLLPLDTGHVTLNGRILEDAGGGRVVPTERRSIGVVFQDYLLFPHLTVLENVAYGPLARGVPRREAIPTARTWLDRVGIASLANARPTTLSGGEAQRTALARALATEPAFLLLDEPLAALDATTRSELRRDLRTHLSRFAGVRLLVTHDPIDALTLADRVIVLDRGTVVQDDTVAEVALHPRSRFVADLVGINLVRGLARAGHLTTRTGVAIAIPESIDGEAFAAFRPSAVALYRERPHGTPRNVFAGTIDGVEMQGERCRVSVGGTLPLVAEVTPEAVRELRLTAGGEIWASIKALEIAVYPV